MTCHSIPAWVTASLVLASGALFVAADGTTQSREILSQTYTIDRKYRSMEGPQSTQGVVLLPDEPPQLVWIRGYRAVMVGPDGVTLMPQEFMCHSNLDFDIQQHQALLKAARGASSRLFTLSQGQLSIQFPEGFGIPVLSNEPLSLTTQVLNHNVEGKTFGVRHRITIDFVRDRDLSQPIQPLFPAGVYGLALLNGPDGYYGVENAEQAKHGPGCLIGTNASSHTYTDSFGRTFTGHWVVKPGREVNRTLVTRLMNLPYDTTIHYIAVHLHPFAESLELRDLTTGTRLFKSRARNFEGRIGLDHVDDFSSREGLPVYQHHEYELVSVYNNTTTVPQDSMAVMYLYLLDKEFHKPAVTASAAPHSP